MTGTRAPVIADAVTYESGARLTERPAFRATGGMLLLDWSGAGSRVGAHHVKGITLTPRRLVPDLRDAQTVELLAQQVRDAMGAPLLYASATADGEWVIREPEGRVLTVGCVCVGLAWACAFLMVNPTPMSRAASHRAHRGRCGPAIAVVTLAARVV